MPNPFNSNPYAGTLQPADNDVANASLKKINALLWQLAGQPLTGGNAGSGLGLSVSSATPYTIGNATGNGSFTISTEVLAGNASRKAAYICNNGGVGLYLNVGFNAVTGEGLYLAPGAVFEINSTNLTTSPIFAIPASGAGSISVMEGV